MLGLFEAYINVSSTQWRRNDLWTERREEQKLLKYKVRFAPKLYMHQSKLLNFHQPKVCLSNQFKVFLEKLRLTVFIKLMWQRYVSYFTDFKISQVINSLWNIHRNAFATNCLSISPV